MNPQESFRLSARREKKDSFTLIELLVVMAIIIILMALLFPAISGARERANVGACMSNMKQIAAAVFNYAADHTGALPTNYSGGASTTYVSWVQCVGGLTTGATGDPNDPTNLNNPLNFAIQGINAGTLFRGGTNSYISDFRVFLCPSYPAKNYGRSYSMASYIDGSGQQSFNGTSTILQLRAKKPSFLPMILEEDPGLPTPYGPADGRTYIDDAYFAVSTAYTNRPGRYHLCTTPGTGKCNVVFLDGHGETLNAYPWAQDQVGTTPTGPHDEVWTLYFKYILTGTYWQQYN